MIRLALYRLLGLLDFRRGPSIDRAHRAYRLKIGKSVLVKNALELTWLEDDYELIYSATPLFQHHKHPALQGEEQMVSLLSELRTSW